MDAPSILPEDARLRRGRGTATYNLQSTAAMRTFPALSAATLAAGLAGACCRPPEITRTGCEAPPEFEAAWRAVDDLWEDCGARVPCWREKLEAARNMRDRYPAELLAHRALAATIVRLPRQMAERKTVRADERRAYEESARRYPKNPAYPYLIAQLEENRKARRALLERAAALDPDFPWAHEALVRALSWKPTDDEKKAARGHLDGFARICPSRTGELLARLADLGDRDAWEAHAPVLREVAAAGRAAPDDLRRVWELEFKFADPARFPGLREEVRRRIASLPAPDRVPDRRWLSTLEEGYKLTGDEAGTRAVEDARLSRFPCSWDATRVWLRRFEKEHGKCPEADGEPRRKWHGEQSAAMEPRLARCPEEPFLWQVHLNDLVDNDASDPARVEAAADRVLSLLGEEASGRVAEAYIEKGIRLDRVPSLLEADRRRIEESWKDTEAAGLDEKYLRQSRFYSRYDGLNNSVLRVRLALVRKDPAASERALAGLAADVERIGESATDAGEKQMVDGVRAELWKLRGESEALAGRGAPALAAYAKSIEKNPDDEKVRKDARALYVRVRGSAAGFDEWRTKAERAGREASEEVTRASHRPLPELGLADLSGKRWTVADLKRKAVLVNFWATWCGPCRSELPHVQKLHERIRGNAKLAIVTISVDDNPGLIEPFLKENRYTFPVLVGGAGSFSKFAAGGIPQTYVVDSEGTIVEEQLGFGGDGERWGAKMEASLEAALSGTKKADSTASR
jgi:thiol-disulfide isomerase/thioredoxin